jgi:hypothetical protein
MIISFEIILFVIFCSGLYQLGLYYCELTLIEEQHLLKYANSKMPVTQMNLILYKMETGENRVGSRQERGREKERSRLRE